MTHRPLDRTEGGSKTLWPPPHYFWGHVHSASHVFQQVFIYPATDLTGQNPVSPNYLIMMQEKLGVTSDPKHLRTKE